MFQPPLSFNAEPYDNVFILHFLPNPLHDDPSSDPLLSVPSFQKHFSSPPAETNKALPDQKHALNSLRQEPIPGLSRVRDMHGGFP